MGRISEELPAVWQYFPQLSLTHFDNIESGIDFCIPRPLEPHPIGSRTDESTCSGTLEVSLTADLPLRIAVGVSLSPSLQILLLIPISLDFSVPWDVMPWLFPIYRKDLFSLHNFKITFVHCITIMSFKANHIPRFSPVFFGHVAVLALSLLNAQFFIFYRASPTCLTECSSQTQHKSKCTMPALRRLSKVCIGVFTRHIYFLPCAEEKLNVLKFHLFVMSCRCSGRLQWDNLCIWTDIIWKNAHYGGKYK